VSLTKSPPPDGVTSHPRHNYVTLTSHPHHTHGLPRVTPAPRRFASQTLPFYQSHLPFHIPHPPISQICVIIHICHHSHRCASSFTCHHSHRRASSFACHHSHRRASSFFAVMCRCVPVSRVAQCSYTFTNSDLARDGFLPGGLFLRLVGKARDVT
jgi:hypothetical protein